MNSTLDGEPRNIAPRVLASVALAACGLAVFLVVSGAFTGGDQASSEQERPRSERQQNGGEDEKSYVVAPGDTLSGIAEKTGVPQQRLERLNPDLDAQTLNAGQEIRLRR